MTDATTKLVRGLGLAVVAEAALPYVVFGAPTGGVLVSVYLAAGLADLLVTLIQQQRGEDAVQSAFQQTVLAAAARQAKIAGWRQWLISGLVLFQRLLCWPAFEFGLHRFRMAQSGVSLRGRVAISAAITLFPYETSVSLFLVVAAALTTAAALWTGHPTVYARAFLWLLIAATAAKHLTALLSPLGMAERLRRGIDPVILSYVFITAADFACLLLAYNGVVNWQTGPVLSGASLHAVFDQLRVFKDLLDAWEHLPPDAGGYLPALSGILWLWTLGDSLLKIFSTGRRTTDDQLAVAGCCATVGMARQARTALDATEPTTREQYEQKGLVYALLGDFAAAAPWLDEFLRQFMLGKPAPSPDYRMSEMIGVLASAPDPTALFDQLLAYGVDNGMSDAFAACFALSARDLGVDAAGIATRLRQSGRYDRLPLAYVAFNWIADREREVLDFFDRLTAPAAAADRATWRFLQVLLVPARQLTATASAGELDAWTATALPALLDDLAAATPLDRWLVRDGLVTAVSYLRSSPALVAAATAAVAALDRMPGTDEVVTRNRQRAGTPVAAAA